MEEKVDPFGFKNVSQNYDKDRPRYSQRFLDEIIKHTSPLTNFIDIASGTGFVFYQLANKFHGNLVINDRSSKQLQVAKDKFKNYELEHEKVEFIESDAFDIHKNFSTPTKFDLVTVAQALHWFDTDKFCEYVINNLLSEDGTFAVLGYFRDGFDYNFPEDPEFMKSGQKHYDKYYSIVLPYYDCDRVSLDQGFKNFDFTKYFEKVEVFRDETQEEVPIERFTNYLGTSSAYNLYKNKYEKDANYEDPIEVLRKNVHQDLEAYYKKRNIPVKEKPLIMKLRYFLWILKKGIKY